MQIMKQFLALLAAALGAAVCHAQALPAGQAASSPQDVAVQKRGVTVQKPVPAPSSTPHKLSAQERAELRRQLSEYSRVAGKGS